MNVLVIGGGGREHALAWKLGQSEQVERVYCAPGNAGTAQIAENVSIDLHEFTKAAKWAEKHDIALTVVGPEQPLADGIVDVFREHGLAVFGPTKAAAKIESSKAFAKDFMKKYNIPTAGYKPFHSGDEQLAREYVRTLEPPYVVKADGLAAGKGVIVTPDLNEAELAIQEILGGEKFGDAGKTLIVEEYLDGFEVSIFAITDGTRYATLAPSQDHKRILDGDKGLNTGGMGAFAPTPHLSSEELADIKMRVIKRTLDGMKSEGTPYTGLLYAGMMMTSNGPKVLEFNCRFGDPETQVVLPLVKDDLFTLLLGAANGDLGTNKIEQHDANAVCVIMASNGYPSAYEKGKRIDGLDSISSLEEGVVVFHAGTKTDRQHILTNGGRVLGVTAIGEGSDFKQTISSAYNAVQRISFDGAYYRTDIGKKALHPATKEE